MRIQHSLQLANWGLRDDEKHPLFLYNAWYIEPECARGKFTFIRLCQTNSKTNQILKVETRYERFGIQVAKKVRRKKTRRGESNNSLKMSRKLSRLLLQVHRNCTMQRLVVWVLFPFVEGCPFFGWFIISNLYFSSFWPILFKLKLFYKCKRV